MIRAAFIVFLIGAFTIGAMAEPGFRQKRRDIRIRSELKLVSQADLARLRVDVIAPGRVRTTVKRITDMLVVVSARGSDIDAVMRVPNGQKPNFGRALFRARLFAVTGGLIHSDANSWCGGWRENVSRCELDCDGGAFLLRRMGSRGERTRLDLVVRGVGERNFDVEPGFAINACQYESPHQLRIVPVRGQKVVPLAFEER